MAFTVGDFQDLLRLLDAHPAWRHATLGKLGTPVVPVVAGEQIIPEADDYARARGAWQLLDGRMVAPDQPSPAPMNRRGIGRHSDR